VLLGLNSVPEDKWLSTELETPALDDMELLVCSGDSWLVVRSGATDDESVGTVEMTGIGVLSELAGAVGAAEASADPVMAETELTNEIVGRLTELNDHVGIVGPSVNVTSGLDKIVLELSAELMTGVRVEEALLGNGATVLNSLSDDHSPP